MVNNRDFKAVIQDMTHVYVGASMTVEELMSYEDVPFKIKAIFNKYFGDEAYRTTKICDIFSSVDEKNFFYTVIKQLKLTFKVGVYEEKGQKRVYRSKTLKIDDYLKLVSSENEFFVEEIVFNKLSLLAFST